MPPSLAWLLAQAPPGQASPSDHHHFLHPAGPLALLLSHPSPHLSSHPPACPPALPIPPLMAQQTTGTRLAGSPRRRSGSSTTPSATTSTAGANNRGDRGMWPRGRAAGNKGAPAEWVLGGRGRHLRSTQARGGFCCVSPAHPSGWLPSLPPCALHVLSKGSLLTRPCSPIRCHRPTPPTPLPSIHKPTCALYHPGHLPCRFLERYIK